MEIKPEIKNVIVAAVIVIHAQIVAQVARAPVRVASKQIN